MDIELAFRVTGPDFCAGALFAHDGQAMRCIRAAPKLQALEGMDAEKAQRRCEAMGFKVERLQPYTTLGIVVDPTNPQRPIRRYRESGRYGLSGSQ